MRAQEAAAVWSGETGWQAPGDPHPLLRLEDTRRHSGGGCHALWAAVIEQAIDDVLRYYQHTDPFTRSLYADAWAWMHDDDHAIPSFVWCCHVVGLDPHDIRRRLHAVATPRPRRLRRCP